MTKRTRDLLIAAVILVGVGIFSGSDEKYDPVADLNDAALNYVFYRNMAIICNGSGEKDLSLKHAHNMRVSNHYMTDRWSDEEIYTAVEAAEDHYKFNPISGC